MCAELRLLLVYKKGRKERKEEVIKKQAVLAWAKPNERSLTKQVTKSEPTDPSTSSTQPAVN